MRDVPVLEVRLYGEPIGSLTRVGGDRILFAFNDGYIENDQRPVLSLGFKDRLGGLITDFRPTQTRLLPFFSNLLPEDPMRAYLADRAGVNPVREFFLLSVLGQDLPGAITVTSASGESMPADTNEQIDRDQVSDHDNSALHFSLAGVQLKFSALEAASGGLTIPAKGVGGDWVIKLPSREFGGVPENEFAMMTLARLIGMEVPEVKLIPIAAIGNLPEEMASLTGQALAIRRFDRTEGRNVIHIEDFAQIFGVYPEDKYKKASYRNIASVIGIECTQDDISEFIRRLTFTMLIGNADMHLKNWSLIYPDSRVAKLAPAYDFVSTIAFIKDQNAALKISRTKRFDQFSREELSHLAAKALLPEKLVLDAARETVELFQQHWQAEKYHLSLTRKTIKTIEAHVKSIPLCEITAE